MRGFVGFLAGASVARATLTAVSATSLVAGAALGGAPLAIAKEDKAAKPANSPEFIKVAGPLQKAVADLQAMKGKATDADIKAAAVKVAEQLAGIEASIKTPLDRVIAGQWQQQVGGTAGDSALQQKGLQNMADSGQLPPDKVGLVQFYLGAIAYQNDDYPTAVKALKTALDDNFTNENVGELLVDAYAKLKQPADGLAILKAAIAQRKAAGVAIPASWYKRGQVVAYNAKLGPQSVEWTIGVVASDPTPINWLGSGQIVRQFGNFGKEESVDLGRLFLISGALGLQPQYTKSEFVEYIQSADPRKSPAEVLKVIDAGVATGALEAKDPFITDAQAVARGRIAKGDKESLASIAVDAGKAADGKLSLVAADGYISYGEAAKAEALYKQALVKGGIDADRVNTRLGIALVDEGKFDDAKAAFAAVSPTGTRGALAQLWSVLAVTKGAK